MTIFIQVFYLWYSNMRSTSFIDWKLCAFRQRSKFGLFLAIFHHNFWMGGKILILRVLLERSSSDVSAYILFQIQSNIVYLWKSIFKWWITLFFQNTSKITEFWKYIEKNIYIYLIVHLKIDFYKIGIIGIYKITEFWKYFEKRTAKKIIFHLKMDFYR